MAVSDFTVTIIIFVLGILCSDAMILGQHPFATLMHCLVGRIGVSRLLCLPRSSSFLLFDVASNPFVLDTTNCVEE